MANVEIIHKGAGQILFENEHTEAVEFVIDNSAININNLLDVEIRIYFNNPDSSSKDIIVWVDPATSPTQHTGRSIPPGEHTVILRSSDFPNSPYENYLLDYAKDKGKINILIEADPSVENLFYLGSDVKLSLISCTGFRRWLCLLFCKDCFVG